MTGVLTSVGFFITMLFIPYSSWAAIDLLLLFQPTNLVLYTVEIICNDVTAVFEFLSRRIYIGQIWDTISIDCVTELRNQQMHNQTVIRGEQ